MGCTDNKIISYAGLPQEIPLQPRQPHLRVIKRPDLQLHEHLDQGQQTHHPQAPQGTPLRRPHSRHLAAPRAAHPQRTLQHLPPRLLLQRDRQDQRTRRTPFSTQAMYIVKCLVEAKMKDPLYYILSPQGICVSEV